MKLPVSHSNVKIFIIISNEQALILVVDPPHVFERVLSTPEVRKNFWVAKISISTGCSRERLLANKVA